MIRWKDVPRPESVSDGRSWNRLKPATLEMYQLPPPAAVCSYERRGQATWQMFEETIYTWTLRGKDCYQWGFTVRTLCSKVLFWTTDFLDPEGAMWWARSLGANPAKILKVVGGWDFFQTWEHGSKKCQSRETEQCVLTSQLSSVRMF